MVARHGRDRTCLRSPGRDRWTYGDLLDRANQIANVLVDDLGLVPGNRVLLRGPNNPWLVAAGSPSSRPAASSCRRCRCCGPGELATIGEIGRFDLAICDAPLHRRPRGGGESRTCDPHDLRRRPAPADDLDALAERQARRLRQRRHRRRRRLDARLHLRHDRPAQGDDALPPRRARQRRHLLALRPQARRPTTSSPAPRRSPSPSASAGWSSSRCASAPPRLLVEKATPDQLADLIEEHGVTVCFTAPTAYRAMIASRQGDTARTRCAGRSRPASTCPAPPGRPSARPPASSSSTASARRRCCTSSSRPADDDIRPGSTGRPVPGYRAKVVDESTATRCPTASRAAWRCRDRPAAATSPTSASRSTSRTAGTSPATPSSATPTATSGTRPAATT